MTYRIQTIIAILLLAVVAHSAEGVSSDIKKYDFDQGTEGWSLSGGQIDHAKQLGRNYTSGIRISSPSAGAAPFTNKSVEGLIPEATYELSAWAKTAEGSPAVTAAVKIEYYNNDGRNTSGKYSRKDLEIDSEWKQINLTLEAGSDTLRALIYLRVYGKGSVIFDDVSFKIAEAPPALVVSPNHQIISQNQESLLYNIRLNKPWTKKELPKFQAKSFRLNNLAKRDVSSEKKLPLEIVEIDKSNYQLKVDVSSLMMEESYLFEFSYHKDGEELKATSPKYAFSVLPNRKPKNLTDNGVIIHAGKPFFPIGMYHAVNRPSYKNGLSADNFDDLKQHDQDYRLLAENGFNAVQGNITHDLDHLGTSLDIAQKNGIAVDVPLYLGHKVADNLDISLEKIGRFGNHPAILSWKIEDEPNLRPNIVHEIPVVYNALKKAEKTYPLELTFMGATNDVWTNFSDVAQIDEYPLPGRSIRVVHSSAKGAKAHLAPWQNLSFVLQSGWTADLTTQPTVAQARSMVYLALIEGAKGIWWYSMYDPGWDLTKTPLWPHFKSINAETQALSKPVMLGEHINTVTGNNAKVLFRALKYADKLYVLVTNPENEPQNVTLQFPANLSLSKGKTLGGETLPFVKNHQLELSLDAVDSQTLIFDID